MNPPSACLLAAALALAEARAQEPVRVGAGQARPGVEASPTAEMATERAGREQELRALEAAAAANADARRRLDAEIAELRTDRVKLKAALLAATERARASEERIGAVEERLDTLVGSASAIRRSLDARRTVVAEVLAVLQRMARRRPPALLARPEDILLALRTSMLLGAVVPELRQEAEALAVDLAELVRLKEAISVDGESLKREVAALSEQRHRLDGLIAARQSRLDEAERGAGAEREKAADLARNAETLKELIDRMERGSSAQRAIEEARRRAEAEARERLAAAAVQTPARLAPKLPFAQARGSLPRPASGPLLREFGAPDGYGGTTRGIAIAARSGAVVSSPADGWVAFAGPFRSFGRLLIINAGDGYYLLLAGMDRISVEVGQFVLAGEPVAIMGASSPASPATGVERNDPALYVEFRKDGGSVDPGPWWAKSQSEKVRG